LRNGTTVFLPDFLISVPSREAIQCCYSGYYYRPKVSHTVPPKILPKRPKILIFGDSLCPSFKTADYPTFPHIPLRLRVACSKYGRRTPSPHSVLPDCAGELASFPLPLVLFFHRTKLLCRCERAIVVFPLSSPLVLPRLVRVGFVIEIDKTTSSASDGRFPTSPPHQFVRGQIPPIKGHQSVSSLSPPLPSKDCEYGVPSASLSIKLTFLVCPFRDAHLNLFFSSQCLFFAPGSVSNQRRQSRPPPS